MLKQLIHKGKERIRAAYTPDANLSQVNESPAKDKATASPVVPPTIAVLGAKGGVGATTVAINLAAAIAGQNRSVTLIDSHFQHPDVATVLGREMNHSITELFARAPEIDRHMFDACRLDLQNAHGNLGLLSPPVDGGAAVTATLSELGACLDRIRTYSDFWVIDTYRHLDKHLVTLSDKCDRILLVFESTVSGVAACKRWLTTFRELGYNSDHIVCVLNRSGSKPVTVEQELAVCFPEQPIFKLPNAHSIVWDCTTRGVNAVDAYPNHAYSRAIKALADLVTGSLAGESGNE